MRDYIFRFGKSVDPVDGLDSSSLGGKGFGLLEMSSLGINTPPGFIISTEICKKYYESGNAFLPDNFDESLKKELKILEKRTGKIFGDPSRPLLLSIRSGAKISMPGMMDTVLNLGINEEIAKGLAAGAFGERFALDSQRRFLSLYSTVVLGLSERMFENIIEARKIESGISEDSKMDIPTLRKIISDFKKAIADSKASVPEDPFLQLKEAIKAVINSWKSSRAVVYRKINSIEDDLGTAVAVQSMVFGNAGEDSATGVVFTRSPITGEKKLFGEFLINAQGEDVVSGTRTPLPIISDSGISMENTYPEIFKELSALCEKLENKYKNSQDIEFTIEKGKLYILQTRNAKTTAASAIKIAVDMVGESLISKSEALSKIDPESLSGLLHSSVDFSAKPAEIAKGLPASPGAASGIIVFSAPEAEAASRRHKVILVRNDTSPEDVKGMHSSEGILTARGGMTSHAAVVARGMGKPCVCGLSKALVDEDKKILKIGENVIKAGDKITLDGLSGKVFLGEVPLKGASFSPEFSSLLSWCSEAGGMEVRANAETVLDAKKALSFGASGIGLCRTEHMFFEGDKIDSIRMAIIATDPDKRRSAIGDLLPSQAKDFKELFSILEGKPINIRLLDPPLHEFLPFREEDKIKLSKNLDMPLSAVEYRLESLREANPMLGHRGCRLGISFPEFYKMQVEAVFAAASELKKETGIAPRIELMVPFISNIKELTILKKLIYEASGGAEFKLGTMIELPRAALLSKEIAAEVDYFSFGTNDLTQTTYGISRDDIGSFLPDYLEAKIFPKDPFVSIDEEGVGKLMEISINEALKGNKSIKFGICGEHAGDPKSIEFFRKIGINYISCSPYRVPVARLASARAEKKK